MPRDPQEIGRRLEGIPLLAALEKADREALATRVSRRRYRARQPIFLQGEEGDELHLLLEGSVRIVAESPDGRDVTLAVLTPGSAFGDMALLDGRPRSASALAMNDCETLVVRRDDFLDVLDRSPASVRRLLAYLCDRIRLAGDRLQRTSLRTVRQRLAGLLRDLARGIGPDGLLPREITHRSLAEMLTTSRESVSREAAVLREQGLIAQEGRRIRVLDPEGLEILAD